MRSNNLIVILCLFLVNSYAQQQTPALELIPGLSNDIAQFIPFYIVWVATNSTECLQTLQCLSKTSKLWHGLVRPEENKVQGHFSTAHKIFGFALSEKFSLTPILSVALGAQVVEEQMKKFGREFNDSIQEAEREEFGIVYGNFTWPHQCLRYAIKQNKKEIVEFLCSFKPINVDIKINTTSGEIPLLAGAIVYNRDENDLTIIDCLLKAGSATNKEFILTITDKEPEDVNNNNDNNAELTTKHVKRNYTPLLLAQKLGKQKIVAKLQENIKNKSNVK